MRMRCPPLLWNCAASNRTGPPGVQPFIQRLWNAPERSSILIDVMHGVIAGPLSRCSDFAGVASSNSVAGPPHAMGEARRPFFDAQVISLENCGGTCAAFVAAMRPARLIVFTMAFLWSASAYADA